jgi:hypothetical protein
MGRNNLEKDFRDQLNGREIKPSAQAWDRLDAMLTVAEEKKPKRSFSWLYIAASFAGLLLVASIFFNQKPELSNAHPVISNPTAIATEKKEETNALIPAQEASEIASASEKPVQKHQPKTTRALQRITESPKQQSVLADNSIINQKSINQNQKPEVADSTNPSENAKADELLALAQAKSKKDAPKSVKVNARTLLSNVEGAEPKGTFKDKVFRTVGKNYQNVKVALSNRNVEEENH